MTTNTSPGGWNPWPTCPECGKTYHKRSSFVKHFEVKHNWTYDQAQKWISDNG